MVSSVHVDYFSQYLNNAAVLYIEGRQFLIRVSSVYVDYFSQYFNNALVLYLEMRQFPIRISIVYGKLLSGLASYFEDNVETFSTRGCWFYPGLSQSFG